MNKFVAKDTTLSMKLSRIIPINVNLSHSKDIRDDKTNASFDTYPEFMETKVSIQTKNAENSYVELVRALAQCTKRFGQSTRKMICYLRTTFCHSSY